MFTEIIPLADVRRRSNAQRRLPPHPCMNHDAHDTVARLHLPVAPKCNIRCHYCRRKVSSSRAQELCPGVSSRILSPSQALAKTEEFLSGWGASAIVGIAGPGDPLANPETFETLELIRDKFPQARLCLCTNGLELRESIDALDELGLTHLTVTINGLRPEVVARIHPWIRKRDRLIRGCRAAQLLIDSQLAGLSAAVAHRMCVKVNTVVIPEINGTHVEAVARQVAMLGARVINLIPLIPRASWAERAKPSPCYLRLLKTRCRQYLPVFDRCKRCRADAEGIPGEMVTL